MTVIVNAIWDGKVCQIVDRQISRSGMLRPVEVVDTTSVKVCVVRCSNALFSVAYTGIAVAHGQWMDAIVARCLAHRPLSETMMQPGIRWLLRPLHVVIRELAINLNGQLNSDNQTRSASIQFSIAGWHLGRNPTPFLWNLLRDLPEKNGMRYFRLQRQSIGKFLRTYPSGLHAESLGDIGNVVDERLWLLEKVDGFTHDDVERHIRDAIIARSEQTATVGRSVLAVQLDPRDINGQVTFTNYPSSEDDSRPHLQSGWTLSPFMVCSPGTSSTVGATYSSCSKYVEGGYIDVNANLHVRTRVPIEAVHHGGAMVLSFGTQSREPVP